VRRSRIAATQRRVDEEGPMRQAYMVLAGPIAVLVVVQAAAIAYGSFAVDKVIAKAKDHGNVVTDASTKLDGGAGYGLHGLLGTMITPVITLILFVVAFLAHVPQGVKWASFVLADVIVQVVLGFAAHSVAALDWLHGPNALVRGGRLHRTPLRHDEIANARPSEPDQPDGPHY
jgi:hypothetical protein